MTNFRRKTFEDSFLYNDPDHPEKTNNANKNIVNFILSAERIDKSNPSFYGICEEVKRMQRSSILYTVLMMENVELCIHNVEMPAAFKVFEAKDLKEGKNGPHKVFIDVTNLVTFKDGYFHCRQIDKLITRLFGALTFLLYRENPIKLLNNSNITISSTNCFVSMVDYIIDYLRIIGYAQNKPKIMYLAALYFQYSLLGKDIDTYAKNIAAKIAGLSTNDTRAFELYYDLKDFVSIKSFIELISGVFKLKGLTHEVFIHRWMESFGKGTMYATELFTAFSVVITDAYCGAYVNNQKQIERCCGKNMVNYADSLLKIGVEEFDNRAYMEASELDKTVARDRNTVALAEAFLKRKKMPEDIKFKKDDFANLATVKTKVEKMVAWYRASEQEHKISRKIKEIAYVAMGAMGSYNVSGKEDYANGVLEAILKAGKTYLNDKDKSILANEIRLSVDQISASIKTISVTDKEKAKRFSRSLVELRKCLKYV